MIYLLLADFKDVTDFFERFFLNALNPVLLLFLLIYLIKCKKAKLSEIRPLGVLIILYVSVDLFLRLYYTFILGMENQTRYFMVQVLFYLFPISIAWDFISKSKRVDRNIFYLMSCTVVALFGIIISLRPKWDKLEFEKFSEVIREHPAKYKYVIEVKKQTDGALKLEFASELAYYSGIYKDKTILKELRKADGQTFYFSKEKIETINELALKIISDFEDGDGDKKYLYIEED